MKQRPIYLDYMATTPVDERVITKMMHFLGKDSEFGNSASSTHLYGVNAAKAIAHAREQVAGVIGAQADEIIWTSGATESDNLAIKGVANFYQRKGRHIISLSTEHKAVLDSLSALQSQGFEVTLLEPEPSGLLDLSVLRQAIRDDTILVSIMHVNNEIGVIQDIQGISELVHERGSLLHVDAAQSAGKIAIDVRSMEVDLMSFSAHKVYGPKGMGALFVRRKPRIRLMPLIHGGGHELGLRSGTLATHQIVGMGEAFEIAGTELREESARIKRLSDKLLDGIADLKGVHLNGSPTQRIPGNLNLSFENVDGESLMLALSELALSTASACTSASIEPSYVLRAIGVGDALAHSAIRLSIGRYTTDEEINKASSLIVEKVQMLREMAP